MKKIFSVVLTKVIESQLIAQQKPDVVFIYADNLQPGSAGTAKDTKCSKGHPGEGKPAWIFTDQIIVN